jgi:hypothetical protein
LFLLSGITRQFQPGPVLVLEVIFLLVLLASLLEPVLLVYPSFIYLFICFLSVVVQGYTWYYFSGVRKIVARVQEAIAYLDQAGDNLAKRKPPSEVLWFLRRAVKSYAAFPGSNFVVDQIFDAVDDKVDAHGDEANALIATAYTQIRDLIQQDGKQHAVQVLGILRNLMKQLQPKSLELKEQMAERYGVEKRRATDGSATAITVAKTKLQDSNLFQQKVWLSWHIVIILALIH